jgi:2-phosphosulfolactate phosphatase
VKLDVFFTPAELAGVELPERVVVIDVLRATSTMVEALANGARAIVPVATADDAARMAQNIGRDSVLLCGERKALPIEGFDLGNAPAEFTAERVGEKSLIMTTTNGTRAFLSVAERRGGPGDAEANVILAGSFLNLSAITERVAGRPIGALADGAGPAAAEATELDGPPPAALVCAGREGRFALEDAVCAGAVVRGLEAAGVPLTLNDGAIAARALASRHMRDLERMLELTVAGRHLREVGRGEDLAFCAALDRTAVIPRFRDRKITLE